MNFSLHKSLDAVGCIAVKGLAFGLLLTLAACAPSAPSQLVVCVSAASGCDYSGSHAIQEAIDAAADGDTILVREGRYIAEGSRDVALGDLTIRGYLLIDGKSLDVVGDGDVVLVGGSSHSSAFVVRGGHVRIHGVAISGFAAASPEDDIYDGHGIFIIDSETQVLDVRISKIEKMSVSVFGQSNVEIRDCEIRDGHLGVWAEDTARLKVTRCSFINNDSAGIGAYASSVVTVIDSVFEENLDDGVYAADQAKVTVSGSTFTRNQPYATRAIDDASIVTTTSRFYDNEQDHFTPNLDRP